MTTWIWLVRLFDDDGRESDTYVFTSLEILRKSIDASEYLLDDEDKSSIMMRDTYTLEAMSNKTGKMVIKATLLPVYDEVTHL